MGVKDCTVIVLLDGGAEGELVNMVYFYKF